MENNDNSLWSVTTSLTLRDSLALDRYAKNVEMLPEKFPQKYQLEMAAKEAILYADVFIKAIDGEENEK
jgi:hypothetical protein